MPSPTVVVGIPTYRRPNGLSRLLRSLSPEIGGHDVLVVVGDNDCGAEAPAVVAASGLDAVCVPVPDPGISAVRNTLIREATARRPAWTHLAMLDDDGYVSPGWFGAMTAAIARFDADVTAGPVLGELPEDASRVARNSVYAGRSRHTSGPVRALTGAQNIVVARRIVDRLGDPWFSPDLGLCGGEDYEFMRRVVAAGGRLAWCDEAEVTEPTPPERLTTSAVVRRAFRSNQVCAHIDTSMFGTRDLVLRTAKDTAWALRNAAAGVVLRDPDRLVRSGLDAVCLSGRTLGMLRRRPPRGSHSGV